MEAKTLSNTNFTDVKKNVSDVKLVVETATFCTAQ